MVLSPLHLTASLAERLVKTPHPVVPAEDNTALVDINKTITSNHDPVASTRMLDDSTGSSSDHIVRKILRKSGVVDNSQQNHVAFGDILAREFNVVMGDHPCCTMGCPLTLGWEYSQFPSVSVDEYEASRSPRRAREDLRTSWDERRNMLGESDGEVKRANRKLARERSCQRKQNRRACAAFFARHEEECITPAAPVSTTTAASGSVYIS